MQSRPAAVSTSASLTERYCSLLSGASFETLPASTRTAATHLILDGLAVAAAGSLEPGPTLLRQSVEGEVGTCAVIGSAMAHSPLAAARANGAAMHVLDFEAMWSPANHATSTTVPAVLAAAQIARADGAAVLTAFVAGVEAQARLRLASQLLEPRQFSMHPPGQVGPIGAAVGAGHVLRLSPMQLRHAAGIAASSCAGLMANVGSMTKALHCGNAAANGLMAALLARRGYTANPDIFDAPSGYAGSIVPRLDAQTLCAIGKPWMIDEPGFAIKLFPSQYGTHFGITAALEAASQFVADAPIADVVVHTPEMPYVDRPRPQTGLEGKFSFQYTVAAALLDRRVGIDSFADERLLAADMQALLPRIRVIPNLSVPAHFENMKVEVAVQLQDGRSFRGICTAPRGYLTKGAKVTDEEVTAKAKDCLARLMSDSAAESVVANVLRLSTLSAAELQSVLLSLAVAPPAAP